MIRRLMEQRAAIDRIAFEKRQFDLTLSDGEWNLLQPMINLLTPIEEASLLFCKSTLSAQFPYAKALVNELSKINLRVPTIDGDGEQQLIYELEDVRDKLIFGIKERFFGLESEG